MTDNQCQPGISDVTCFIERSKVREILITSSADNETTQEVLREIDALPIFNAGDFRSGVQTEGDKPSHVMCIGWPTIKRLAAGESVWFEELECGAVAASDLCGTDIDALLSSLSSAHSRSDK